MKEAGIIRRVDDLGRIVLPMEFRRTLGVKTKDPLSMRIEDDCIIISKPVLACVICGKVDAPMFEFKGRSICEDCFKQIHGADSPSSEIEDLSDTTEISDNTEVASGVKDAVSV